MKKLLFLFIFTAWLSQLLAQNSVQEAWVRHYNSGLFPGQDFATAIAVDKSGNVYVTGEKGSGYDDISNKFVGDYLIIKYNSTGSEQWVATYNGPGNSSDRVIALAVDAASNVYVTGNSTGALNASGNDIDYATIKYNSAGTRLWLTRYHKLQRDFVAALALDPLGNVYVTGTSALSGGLPNFATVKYDSTGVEQWVVSKATKDDGFVKALAVDAAGNVYITGTDSFDYLTLKYNTAGVELWTARYNERTEWSTALSVDTSGNVFVTGKSLSDYTTVKYNSAGVQQWAARHAVSGNIDDVPTAMVVDTEGNVYLTGTTWRDSLGISNRDYITIKHNSVGEQQWDTYYASSDSRDRAAAMAIDPAGDVVVAGTSREGFISANYTTLKYNSDGGQLWKTKHNGGGETNAIVIDNVSNIYVTGGSSGTNSLVDYATVKYNASGVEQWIARYNGPQNFLDVATDVAVDTTGNVYVTGASDAETFPNFTNYTTIKYNAAGVAQWIARYESSGTFPEKVPHLAVDATGNVYVTGGATIKYDSTGVEKWAANHGNGFTNAIALDAMSNVYVTGESQSDFLTIKYNSAGVEQWNTGYNGPGNYKDVATAIVIDPGGNVYITGKSWAATISEYATIKYNPAGVQQWVARYSGLGMPYYSNNEASALALDIFGNVYVTGNSMGIYKPGISVENNDFATIKYNSTGAEQWVIRYGGPGYCFDEAKAIAVDGKGDVYVTGWSEGANGGGGWSVYTTVKYVQNTVDVAKPELYKPNRYELLQNHPNPFNPSTTIRYAIAKPSHATLKVFNLQGQEIATLVNENKVAGEYEIQWNPTDVPSGVYLYRLQAGEFMETKRLILMK